MFLFYKLSTLANIPNQSVRYAKNVSKNNNGTLRLSINLEAQLSNRSPVSVPEFLLEATEAIVTTIAIIHPSLLHCPEP